MGQPHRNRLRPCLALSILLLLLARAGLAASTREIRVPLRFDEAFLREALVAQVYTAASGKAVLWDDGSGCNFLKLRDPQVAADGARLRITTRGEARIGTAIGSSCIAPVRWDGSIEVFEEPVIAPDQRSFRFRVVDSKLYGSDGKKPLIAGPIWDLVKSYVHPSFEAVHVDLGTLADDLRSVLPELLIRDDLDRLRRIADSLRLADATTFEHGVAITLAFQVDPRPAFTPAPEPTFTSEELDRWQEQWQRWDAFLTYVIKFVWSDTLISDLRRPLADVLLDARYDLIEALAPESPASVDPVPDLFVRTWERFAPVARRIASDKPGAVAVRYFSFIAAADALVALKEAGPDVGVDISADGLRRLARMLVPLSSDDPLVYDTRVDPQLRTLLGFGAPLPAPDLEAAPADSSWWKEWLWPRAAWATAEGPAPETLRRWIASPETLDVYLPAVREVLDAVTIQTLEGSSLAAPYHEVYRRLVLATAWQESCWRQFILRSGQITYLKSGVGASGLMQVNERVWRGVYDLKGLRWDIRYNGRAGAEIALHYLNDYAIAKKEHQHPGGIDNLARATYAIYNGGPGHISRYRKPNTRPSLKKIDAHFLEKYQAVSQGRAMDVATCYGR
jgi:hypothetical protein